MKRCVVIFLALSILAPVLVDAEAPLTEPKKDVYITKVMLSPYYHVDPMCMMSAEWFLPMKPIQREILNRDQQGFIRPCFLCATEESESFLSNSDGQYTEGEVAAWRQMDEYNSKLINYESFTLQDWAEFSAEYAVPSTNDISQIEALNIAVEKIANEYGIKREYVQKLSQTMRLHSDIEAEDTEGLKKYEILFIDMNASCFYWITLTTPTGEILEIEQSDFSQLL